MRSPSLMLCLVLAVDSVSVASAQEAPPVRTDSVHSTPEVAIKRPARSHVRPGDRLFIQPTEFGLALSAAILKKEVPVTVTTDSASADFVVLTTSEAHRAGGAEKTARILFGSWGSGDNFKASTTVLNRDGDVVFAYNSQKSNFQATAQNLAKNLKKHVEHWRDHETDDLANE